MLSATLLNQFSRVRDNTLASLSSQLQNFNFCNFFFKTSETNSSSGTAGYVSTFITVSQKLQSTHIRRSVNTLFQKFCKNFHFR